MRSRYNKFFLGLFCCLLMSSQGPPPAFRCARIHYKGGGDWYNDPAAIPNLMKYIQRQTGVKTPKKEDIITPSDPAIFQYSFVFMTGHGEVKFSSIEISNLRNYLESGGFIYIDDDYGMDKSIRREIKKLFPNKPLQEIPYTHSIYNIFFPFTDGFPKIHQHDGKPPQSFGIFINNRLSLLYTYEMNPSDGWVATHEDSPEIRDLAFKIGTNIVLTAITK